MKKRKVILPWISIALALASAVGIYFLPEYHIWFLVILLINLLVAFVFGKKYNKTALTICRLLVGALFIFSSFTKGVDPLGTKYKMLDYLSVYGMTWLNDFALVLAMGMILAEFLVGICLITKILPRLAVLGATLLMLFFTITTLFDALNNKHLRNPIGIAVQLFVGVLFAGLFLGFEIYNYRHLPVIDFMNWKVGKQMNAEPTEKAKIYLIYRNKATGETQEYVSPNYPWNDSVWMSQWEFVDQRTEGGANFLGFSALDEDGNDVTESILTTDNLLMFTSHDLTKVTENEWEKVRVITEAAEKQGFIVIWTVADEPEYVEKLREKYGFLYEVYYADELEIKPIVRSNPGLIWLDNGLVKDKWSAVDFNKVLKVL